MGTRGNVIIKETKEGKFLCNIYHHMDSYPEGLGKTLADFLKDRKVVNGLGDDEKVSNGPWDLAAQIVCLLKETPENAGMVYLYPTEKIEIGENDYTYIIYPETHDNEDNPYLKLTGGIHVEVYQYGGKNIFKGTANEFLEWINRKL